MHESLESTNFRLFRCVIGRPISILTGSTAPTLHDNQDNVCVCACASISSMRNKDLPPGRGLSFVQVFSSLAPLFSLVTSLIFSLLFSFLSSLVSVVSLSHLYLLLCCFYIANKFAYNGRIRRTNPSFHLPFFFTPSLFGIFAANPLS